MSFGIGEPLYGAKHAQNKPESDTSKQLVVIEHKPKQTLLESETKTHTIMSVSNIEILQSGPIIEEILDLSNSQNNTEANTRQSIQHRCQSSTPISTNNTQHHDTRISDNSTTSIEDTPTNSNKEDLELEEITSHYYKNKKPRFKCQFKEYEFIAVRPLEGLKQWPDLVEKYLRSQGTKAINTLIQRDPLILKFLKRRNEEQFTNQKKKSHQQ